MNFVQFAVLPACCVLCGRSARGQLDLCDDCWPLLPVAEAVCHNCALPLPPGADSLRCATCCHPTQPLACTVTAFRYEEPAVSLVTRFKYQRDLAAGRVLANCLAERLRTQYRGVSWPQLLLPVPLHSQRLRQRGYNQAALVATDLSRALGIPTSNTALCRTRATPPQQGLDAAERRRNLRGAFEIAAPRALHGLHHVALVDDVVTTMSTVREVARTLQRAKPSLQVDVWCLARA